MSQEYYLLVSLQWRQMRLLVTFVFLDSLRYSNREIVIRAGVSPSLLFLFVIIAKVEDSIQRFQFQHCKPMPRLDGSKEEYQQAGS